MSRGRPRLPEGVKQSEGKPRLQVRLDPDLHAWAAEKGNAYIRDLLEREREHEREMAPDISAWAHLE